MVTAAELAAEVRRAAADTPYMVTDETPTGFTVQVDSSSSTSRRGAWDSAR